MQQTSNNQPTLNQSIKEAQLQTRLTLALLNEQTHHLQTLRSCYTQLAQQLTNNHTLLQQKRQLQLTKESIISPNATTVSTSNILVLDRQKQCATREQQLKSIKEQLVSNAVSVKAISKQNQQLLRQNQQLEQRYASLRATNNQKRKLMNQVQRQIRDTTAQLTHQRTTHLELKKQLAQVRLNSQQHHSHSYIAKLIMKQQEISDQMRTLLQQLVA